ncbi:MAG: hypothetical protein WCK48_02555 [bacterium]
MFAPFLQFLKSSGSFTTDLFVLGAIFLLFFFYALYFGKSKIISLLISFYPAYFFYENFPFFDKLLFLKGDSLLILNKAAIFLLFLIPINIMVGRYIFSEFSGGSKHYFRIAGYALAGVVLVLIFSYRIVSLDSIYKFSPVVANFFVGTDRQFWATLVPLALLLLL